MVGTVAGVLLGAVFLVAGASKLASRTWPAQAAALGAPAGVAPAIPWLELVIGAGLVAQLAPRVVGVAAVLLLGAFTVLLGLRLSQGRRPPCACFGGRTPKPISWLSVARNLALLAVALVVILG